MNFFKIAVSIALCVTLIFCLFSCTKNESVKGANDSSIRPLETPSFDFDTIETADLGELFSEHTYVVTYRVELEYNNSVGNEWIKGVQYNGEQIASSSKIVVDKSLTEIEFEAFATELDTWDDYGSTCVVFDALEVGQEQTKWATVIVTEDEGRYTGNTAKWYFEITIERIT